MTPTSEPPEALGRLPGPMEDLADRLAALEAKVREQLPSISNLGDLEALEAQALGKNSLINTSRRGIRDLDPADRPQVGALLNEAADRLAAAIEARRLELAVLADAATLAEEHLDMTLPPRKPRRGSKHVITTVMDEMVDIFVSIGYTVAVGPEVESEYYNFTALNIPRGHPARLDMDTLYVEWGDDPEGVVLRTHTSPMQARYMETHEPPVYLVVPGRVFRRDTIDATHQPVFHQLEGLAVAPGITFADLKGTLAYFIHEFFGPDAEIRLVPDHFPFTEPSAQVHVRLAEDQPWLEMLGCGMVHPAVFEAVGYDPAEVTGFAFGMGVDRFAMLRHGLRDLRELWDGDLRLSRQFP